MHWKGWVHSVVCIVWGGYMCGFGRGMDIITSAMLSILGEGERSHHTCQRTQ